MSRECTKCRVLKGPRDFPSETRKRCTDCNSRQYTINRKYDVAHHLAERQGLFREYDMLLHFHQHGVPSQMTDLQRGRRLLYGGLIKMIAFDTKKALPKSPMTLEERQYWIDLEKEIVEAGKILFSEPGVEQLFPWIMAVVPHSLHKAIRKLWATHSLDIVFSSKEWGDVGTVRDTWKRPSEDWTDLGLSISTRGCLGRTSQE